VADLRGAIGEIAPLETVWGGILSACGAQNAVPNRAKNVCDGSLSACSAENAAPKACIQSFSSVWSIV